MPFYSLALMWVRVHLHSIYTLVCTERNMYGVLFCHCLPHSFETGSLTESEARLVVVGVLTLLSPPGAGFTGTCVGCPGSVPGIPMFALVLFPTGGNKCQLQRAFSVQPQPF